MALSVQEAVQPLRRGSSMRVLGTLLQLPWEVVVEHAREGEADRGAGAAAGVEETGGMGVAAAEGVHRGCTSQLGNTAPLASLLHHFKEMQAHPLVRIKQPALRLLQALLRLISTGTSCTAGLHVCCWLLQAEVGVALPISVAAPAGLGHQARLGG